MSGSGLHVFRAGDEREHVVWRGGAAAGQQACAAATWRATGGCPDREAGSQGGACGQPDLGGGLPGRLPRGPPQLPLPGGQLAQAPPHVAGPEDHPVPSLPWLSSFVHTLSPPDPSLAVDICRTELPLHACISRVLWHHAPACSLDTVHLLAFGRSTAVCKSVTEWP